jgi:hypothetical protein
MMINKATVYPRVSMSWPLGAWHHSEPYANYRIE